MEKFRSLLSFALGLCLTSTTFKVLSHSLGADETSKSQISVATDPKPISPLTLDRKSAAPDTIAAEAAELISTTEAPKIAELTPSVLVPPIVVPTPVAVVAEVEQIRNKAISLYKEEIAKDANRPDLWKKIADIENQKEQYQNAIEALQHAIKLQPKNAQLYMSLSESYSANNQSKEALTAIDEALQILNGEPNNQTPHLVLANSETENKQSLIPEAEAAEADKNWDKAISLYKEEIARDANQPDVWHRIADIENAQQHYPEAIEALQNAIKLQSKNAALYVSLSETYAVMNQAKESLLAINQALEIDPTNVDYLNRRAILATWAGEQAQAEDSYRRILNIEPNNQQALARLQNIEAEKSPSKPSAGALAADQKSAITIEKVAEDKPAASPIQLKKTASNANLNVGLSGISSEDHAQQAQKYAEANRTQEALLHIDLAVKKEPHNIAYHKLRAEMALVEKNYELARKSYCYILAKEPYNKDALLGMTNLEVQQNHFDKAVCAYEDYLALYPDSKTVWLDYARIQSWRGNFVSAFHLLREYKDRYGETYEYLSAKARLFQMAGYPEHALSLVNALLLKSPNDYDLRFTEAVALQGHGEPCAALQAFHEIERKFPKNPDNKELIPAIVTPNRSSLTLGGYGYRDTDDIKMLGSSMYGEYVMTPETRLLYGVRGEVFNTTPENAFGLDSQQTRIWDSAEWAGLRHQISPEMDISGIVGAGEIGKTRPAFFLYDFNINTSLNDYLKIGLQKGQDLYAGSPRAVSLKILQRYNRMTINWEPYVQKYLAIGLEYDKFSDKNKMKGLTLNPYATIFSSQYFQVNFGPYANWQKYSFNAGNGYYDPRVFQLYQGLSQITFKQSENINYVLTLAAGTDKDETMLKRGFAWDVTLQGMYGIYADWQFNISASAINRHSGSLIQGSGAKYRGYSFQTSLTRRF